ncbi:MULTISPECIES: DMT family transporter [Acinetobacter]|uniref:EamA family transporter n=1 Tax=Acinetobacter TaxID=469 RepID=UPI00051C2F98|nr:MULTISPECIES: EamA family transporter [Acinetobacter]MCH7380518.1 EamA family transporter [Acinetobacter higginsii]
MRASVQNKQEFALAAACLSLASVQIGAAIAKTLFPIFGAEGVALIRLSFSALLLWMMFKPWRSLHSQMDWKNLIIYGLILSLMNLLIYKAFSHLSIGIAISIEVLGPLTVAIVMSKQKQDLLWGALSFIGLMLLPLGSSNQNFSYIGMFYALAAAFCWGMYIIYGSKVAKGGSNTVAIGMLVATLIALPFGISDLNQLFHSYWILLLCVLVSLLSSTIPFLLDIFAMKKLEPKVFGILLSASPAVSALAGWLILKEHLNPYQITGIAIIMLSCAGCSYFSYKNNKA